MLRIHGSCSNQRSVEFFAQIVGPLFFRLRREKEGHTAYPAEYKQHTAALLSPSSLSMRGNWLLQELAFAR